MTQQNKSCGTISITPEHWTAWHDSFTIHTKWVSVAKIGGCALIPISADKFIVDYLKNNPGEDKEKLREALALAAESKRNGTSCIHCGLPIWAIGTAIVGWNGCFRCITSEADDSEDYEIDCAGE
jgi:hypothetical protein